jgi:hypothetical protein
MRPGLVVPVVAAASIITAASSLAKDQHRALALRPTVHGDVVIVSPLETGRKVQDRLANAPNDFRPAAKVASSRVDTAFEAAKRW